MKKHYRPLTVRGYAGNGFLTYARAFPIPYQPSPFPKTQSLVPLGTAPGQLFVLPKCIGRPQKYPVLV